MTNGSTLWRVSGALNGCMTVGLAAVLLSGCATGNAPTVATCLDDSSACVSKRKATLNSMLADPNRTWVARKPGPAVYATGVRLFAWRRTRDQLTCRELRSGIAETGAARQTLSRGVNGASKTRLGQIVALSDDVNAELKRTSRGKKCPKT